MAAPTQRHVGAQDIVTPRTLFSEGMMKCVNGS